MCPKDGSLSKGKKPNCLSLSRIWVLTIQYNEYNFWYLQIVEKVQMIKLSQCTISNSVLPSSTAVEI